jgi:TIR domain
MVSERVSPVSRQTVFVTHAAPEDNEFALWIASKLALAGYRVWIDRRRLRGGDDFWDEIDRVLRAEAIKQVIVFTRSVGKAGVKKELAIGDIMKQRLGDLKFMIPIRADDIAFSDAPPEFVRENILDAHPNWHDCIKDLFEALDSAGVPKLASPDATILRSIINAREDGRRFVRDIPEEAFTNWFPIIPPGAIRYFRFDGLQEHMRAWIAECSIPNVVMGRLAGSFADLAAFSMASSFSQPLETAYEIPFMEFVGGLSLGPYEERSPASNDIANLLRQHFDAAASVRGLKPVEFANSETGWYFPDDLIPGNRISLITPDGRRIRRTMTGQFRKLRWHLCLQARPRIWPALVFRVRGNVVLSEDGALLPGEKAHRRRLRLTRSWWNDVWRDRLLAAIHFLADGGTSVPMKAGNIEFAMASWPLTVQLPVSYEATDSPLPSEEDEEGNIVPSAALDDPWDEFEAGDDREDPGVEEDT